MPRPFKKYYKRHAFKSFRKFFKPASAKLVQLLELKARGNRPLQMNFEDQLKILVYFHLQEHKSGRHLLQDLEENDFALKVIAPEAGIKKSSFFEAINTRGLEQLSELFKLLQADAAKIIPDKYGHLGDLVAIDGSVIEAVPSMYWADYSQNQKKAKVHFSFDINHNIPMRVHLTDCKVDERPFAHQLLEKDQTGIMDRNYQKYSNFDRWQQEGKHFVCRIRADARKTILENIQIKPDSIIFFDSVVMLGIKKVNQTQKKVRLVAYHVKDVEYWIATDRFDLSAEDVANIYKLRWNIETFFAWWKRHLKVYPIIARSHYGLMVQILAGFITYLLLAIYCHEEFNERVNIKRVRELRNKIQNEAREIFYNEPDSKNLDDLNKFNLYAKT